MRSISKFTVLVLFLILGNEVFAQDKTPVLSGKNVADGIQIYEYVREMDGEETAAGTITEKIERRENRMLITYAQELPRFEMRDSLLLDYESFTPIAYRSRIQDRQNIAVNYSGTEKVDVWIKRKGFGMNQDTSYSVEFTELRYDSHWFPTLVYAIDKEDGSKWSIPVYSSNNNKDVITIEERGEEQITLHGNEYEARRYVISRENSENKYYYWIDKESGRMLQTRGDEEQGMIVWLRIKSEM